MRKLFTSESVTEGHPDKIADQISDSVLDAILAKDPKGRVACETVVTTGQIHVVGEISTTCYVDIASIARKAVIEIGYDRAKYGFDKHWIIWQKECGKILIGKSPIGTRDIYSVISSRNNY